MFRYLYFLILFALSNLSFTSDTSALQNVNPILSIGCMLLSYVKQGVVVVGMIMVIWIAGRFIIDGRVDGFQILTLALVIIGVYVSDDVIAFIISTVGDSSEVASFEMIRSNGGC